MASRLAGDMFVAVPGAGLPERLFDLIKRKGDISSQSFKQRSQAWSSLSLKLSKQANGTRWARICPSAKR